ncbi:MAG TPA: hypothetical protein VGM19_08200 [Armatimonadota bacterium]|jgi:hypothetical protein
MKLTRFWCVALLLLAAGACFAQTPAPAAQKPAILFCCPGENRYEYVGYDYMQSLVQAGFTVDYLEGSAPLTWDKVKNYNVLFVFDFPATGLNQLESSSFQPQPPWLADYWAVLDKFLKAGGGIFLHYCPFYGGAAPNDLLKQWGLQFPLLYLRDPGTQFMTNIHSGAAYTDQINPESPVSKDVHGYWYPNDNHYTGQHTMPILVDDNWRVVARASKAAYTEVPRFDPGGLAPLAGALIPAAPVKDPVLFAVRDYPGGGRLAAVQTWYQWSVGSGMKWLYNNEILSKGLGTRPSDYGKLLLNTYTWLAAPSLQSGAVGGAVQDPSRMLQPMLRSGAIDQFHDWNYNETEVLGYRHPPINGKLFRGLIGAQTALSGGQGTVADYAAAAVAAQLDYVVFLEDLAQMTPEKLDTLKAEVAKNTTPTLQLYAGYRMKSNIGNYMFVCGKNPVWPDQGLLIGPDQRTFNLQYQDENGKWGQGIPGPTWCLSQTGPTLNNTVGYYNFTKSGNGMKWYDVRDGSTGALRTYEGGKLVEDMTPDYLTNCLYSGVLTPISLNLVRSPAELTAAVAQNQALTYAQANRPATIWEDALHWNGSYDGMNAFPSDGPQILVWPKLVRVMVFGAEWFVTSRSLNLAPIHVTSEVGLKQITIYDGTSLYRRIDCKGSKDFETTLVLNGVLQSGLVLIAEDLRGGKATSFPLRTRREGTLCQIDCGDHANDCAYMLLAHGPHWPMFFMTPSVPDAGGTWDGGPLAARPLLNSQFTYPWARTDQGNYEPGTPYQIPELEFADEGATRCRMVSDRVMIPELRGTNPWSGFGPTEPSPIVDTWASHTYFDQYLTGVAPNAWGAPGVFEGPIVGLFTEQFKFKQDCTVKEIQVYNGYWRQKTATYSTLLAMGKGGQITDVWDLTNTPEQPQEARIETGAWFGLFSSQVANTHLFINRGAPLILRASPWTWLWLELFTDTRNQPVKKGDTCDVEVFSQTWPLDQAMTKAKSLADMVTYLEKPTGMELTRGRQVAGPGGLLELTPDNYAVELSIPKPEGVARTVPVRVSGLNRRWTAGLYQFAGYRTHYYSKQDTGWRALGLDFDGRAYAPLYVSKAANTHVLLGHPIVADAAGRDLFIQVSRVNDGDAQTPPAWHVSVNNPTDKPVTTTLKRAMDLAGLTLVSETMTLAPGEYRVLSK